MQKSGELKLSYRPLRKPSIGNKKMDPKKMCFFNRITVDYNYNADPKHT